MTRSPDFPLITESDVGRLFEWLSIDYEGFRQASRQPTVAAQEGYEPYNFNPLVEHPVIKTPDGKYIIPVIQYLFRRVTVGLFYDLIRSSDPGRAGYILGHAFENYIERLIMDLPEHPEPLPEQAYITGKTTCDWILEDPEGVVLVECKRVSLRQRAKTTGEKTDVKRDLAREDGVADGIAKLVETFGAIRDGRLPTITRQKRILPLLVTFDQFFLANSRFMRAVLEEILEERSVELPEEFQYQICSISDFEELCSMLTNTGRSIASALISKVDGEHNVAGDHPTHEWDVSSYVMRIRGDGEHTSLPSHDEVFSVGLEAIVEQFTGRA
jgi:hypothetical protein